MLDFGSNNEVMHLRDSVRGIVVGQNRKGGLYIDMKIEDEESDAGVITVPAFGYWSAPVKKGTEVVCSIKKWAKGNKDIEVRIDSVDYERAA